MSNKKELQQDTTREEMISIKKIEYFLFLFLAFTAYFLPAEIAFVIAFLGIIVAQGKGARRQEALRILKWPIILLPIGLVNAYQNDSYSVLKDIYYFVNPIIVFCFGYLFAYYFSLFKFLKTIIILGGLLAVVYVVIYLLGGDYDSVAQRKDEEGLASYFVVFSIVLLILQRKRMFFPKPVLVLLFVILVFAAIVSQSRTFLLVFILFMIFGTGQLTFNKYFFLKFIGTSLVVMAIIAAIYSIDTTGRDTFMGKLGDSFSEMVVSDYTSKREMYGHWRGFEAYIGLKQMQRGSLFEWIVGQGFGAVAPLGFYQELDGTLFSELPKFHNGYITILLKTGILGFFIYIMFFLKLIISNLKETFYINREYELSKNLIIGLSAVLLGTTAVVAGWLNQSSMLPFIFGLGFMIKAKELIYKKYQVQIIEEKIISAE